MRLDSDTLIVFSGLMFAGKDYVAGQAGLTVRGFSDPMYQLTEYFFGTSNKSLPGIRPFLQRLGQWGWGAMSAEYPATPERAALVHAIRKDGERMTKDFAWVKWSEYGSRQDFWVNILLTRLGLTGTQFSRIGPGSLFPENNRKIEPYRLAITNARFMHELTPCKAAGFEHYHVSCSEVTRRERMTAKGYAFDSQANDDVSEKLAQQFNCELADSRIIWNDHRPMPEGRSFLRVTDFVQRVEAAWRVGTLVTTTTTSAPQIIVAQPMASESLVEA